MGLRRALACGKRTGERLDGYVGYRVDQHNLRESGSVTLTDAFDLLNQVRHNRSVDSCQHLDEVFYIVGRASVLIQL